MFGEFNHICGQLFTSQCLDHMGDKGADVQINQMTSNLAEDKQKYYNINRHTDK